MIFVLSLAGESIGELNNWQKDEPSPCDYQTIRPIVGILVLAIFAMLLELLLRQKNIFTKPKKRQVHYRMILKEKQE